MNHEPQEATRPCDPCAPDTPYPLTPFLHRAAWFFEAVASAVRAAGNIQGAYAELRGRRNP